MEPITKKTITSLTTGSVSILTQQYVEVDGAEKQVGGNRRCSYVNSESGRTLLTANEPEEVVTAVMAVWGDTPTVKEPEIPEYVPGENGGATGGGSGATTVNEIWDEMAAAIEEGVNEV